MEMPRSGFGGAVTCTPSACSRSITPFQPEASAKAPCTRTMVREAAAVVVSSDMRAPYVSSLDCSFAQPIMPSWAAAMVMAAPRRKRRRERSFLLASGSFGVTVDFDDSFGKGLRGFLRQIVPNTARDDPVPIFAREFLGIGPGVRVGCSIGITFKGNGGHGDDRTFGKPLFQIVILWVAFSQAEPPAVIMDHDADVIRVVEGRCAAIERGIIEVPLRRSGLPNELGKVVAVCVVASPAAFGCEIILVPPLELSLWRQRHLVGFRAADQITTHGDHGLAALWPERRDDVGRPRSPIKTGEDRLLDLKSIHQSGDIESDHRLLAVSEGFARKKGRRAIAAQMRDDPPVACLRQQGRYIAKAVNVVGPAVQKDYRRTIGGAGFSVSNIQDAGIDLFHSFHLSPLLPA